MRESIERYCSTIGVDSDYVQGAGGNVSWKQDGILWVKASGTWLADAEEEDIFVGVDLDKYSESIRQGDFGGKVPLKVESPVGHRASIETLFHAVLPDRVVVHTHLIDALYFMVQDDPQAEVQAAIGNDIRWEFIAYAKPGASLGEQVYKTVKGKRLDAIFLGNHGVIVAGDSVAEVQQKYDFIRQKLGVYIDAKDQVPSLEKHFGSENVSGYECLTDHDYQDLAFSEELFCRAKEDWALYPDHVVFLGEKAPLFSSVAEFRNYLVDQALAPDYAIIFNVGVLTNAMFNKNKIAMLNFYTRFLRVTSGLDNLRCLSDHDIAGLLNWDAEKYRQTIAK